MPQSTDTRPVVLIDDAHTLGGTQIALAWTVAVLLEHTRFPVICVCTPRTQAAIEGVTGSNARLTFENAPSAMPLNLFRFPVRIPAYWRILRRLHRRGVRAWWLNLPDIEFGLAPLLVLRALGAVPRSYLHGTTRFAQFYALASWQRRWLSRLRDLVADHILFRLHHLLIAPSKTSRQELQARLRGRPQPATAFLYPPGPEPGKSQASPATREGTGPVELWIVGNVLQVHKNQLAGLATLQELRARGCDATLTVAGAGADLEMLQLRAGEMGLTGCVTWLGWLAEPWAAVPRDAVVLVPSFHETLSLVAREALGCGLRLVVAPLPVFREWVPAMMISPSFAAEDFADTVLRVRREAVETFAAASCAALARFSHQTFADEFAALSSRVA